MVIECFCIQENRESVKQFFEKKKRKPERRNKKWKMMRKQKTHMSTIFSSLKLLCKSVMLKKKLLDNIKEILDVCK